MAQYVEINGLRTWYDEYGDGEPLLLLHGGMCTNETWAAQVPALSERFRVRGAEVVHGLNLEPGPHEGVRDLVDRRGGVALGERHVIA